MVGLQEDLPYCGGPTGGPTTLNELVCRTFKEKCLAASVKVPVGDMEELDEVSEILDTCYNRLEKYIAEALELIIKF